MSLGLAPMARADDTASDRLKDRTSPPGRLTLGAGFDYTQGLYGEVDRTDILNVPFTLKYNKAPLTWKLTVPWVRITGPSTVIVDFGPTGDPVSPITTEEGLGDITASVTWSALEDGDNGLYVDLVGKVKLGTADNDKGLGTGEHDYTLLVDVFKVFGRSSLLASVGRRVYGDPPGRDFRNPWLGSLGVDYRLDGGMNVGLTLDGRQKITPRGSPIREWTAYLTRRLDEATRVQVYLVVGDADASPDRGLGAIINREF